MQIVAATTDVGFPAHSQLTNRLWQQIDVVFVSSGRCCEQLDEGQRLCGDGDGYDERRRTRTAEIRRSTLSDRNSGSIGS